MKLVLIFLTLAFAWCVASNIICQSYNEGEKSLLQSCGNYNFTYKYQLPPNCSPEEPTVLSSNVLHLMIQGCDANLIHGASEKYRNIEKLDISHTEFRLLGAINETFADLTELNATFNSLQVVPKEMISKCPGLIILNLAYNHLERISHGDFEQAQQLKSIDLSHNDLKFIDSNAFGNLSDLQMIRLNHNNFLNIPPLHFRNHPIQVSLHENALLTTFNCTSIAAMSPATVFMSWRYIKSFLGNQGCGARKIRIKHNNGTGYQGISTANGNWDLHCNDQSFYNLQYFVAGPIGFENIHDILPLISATVWTLDLSDNYIGELNQTILERFRTLQELRLKNTKLSRFDVNALNINNQHYLNRLDISYNHLKEIENSRTLQFYTQLIELNAANNQIQDTSEIIKNLPMNMQQLNMAHSNSTNNDNDVKKLTQLLALTHLDLTDKHLSIADLSAFRRLTHFNVSGNDLSDVNFSTLTQFDRLQEFRAANCNIQNVQDVIQYFGPTVEKLDLSGNFVPRLVPRSFERLRNLKELSLSGMGWNENDLTIFESLSSLTHFDISKNNLEFLNAGQLPKTLQQLHLHENRLKKIQNLDRKHFPVLRVLSISQNQLNCDYVDELRAQFKDNVILVGDPHFNPFEQCDTCHSKAPFIILCIVVAVVILLTTICMCFLCRKRLCTHNY